MPTSVGSYKKQENSRKTSTSSSLTTIKALTLDPTNYGKFLKKWEYQTTLPVSWETCIQVKKQQLELDMEQLISSKLGKEYNKAVYIVTLFTEYTMQNVRLDESQAGITRLPGETLRISDMQIIPF